MLSAVWSFFNPPATFRTAEEATKNKGSLLRQDGSGCHLQVHPEVAGNLATETKYRPTPTCPVHITHTLTKSIPPVTIPDLAFRTDENSVVQLHKNATVLR